MEETREKIEDTLEAIAEVADLWYDLQQQLAELFARFTKEKAPQNAKL